MDLVPLCQSSTGSGEDDPHRVESVVRADVVLGLEGGEMLGVGRKVWVTLGVSLARLSAHVAADACGSMSRTATL
jgi:hypothetical protein